MPKQGPTAATRRAIQKAIDLLTPLMSDTGLDHHASMSLGAGLMALRNAQAHQRQADHNRAAMREQMAEEAEARLDARHAARKGAPLA